MSIVLAFLTLFLAALSHASLQLDLGGLILLYHASRSHHVAGRTRALASFYILGAGFMVLSLLAACIYFVSLITSGSLSSDLLAIIVGALLALSIFMWFGYYRLELDSRSTELWVPRFVSRYIDARARSTSSRVEAFSLGMLTIFAEFPFSFLLLILSANSLISLSPVESIIGIAMYVVVALLPLVLCRIFLRSGRTVVDIQRFRVRSKGFFRTMSGTFFAILAVFVFVFGIMGEF